MTTHGNNKAIGSLTSEQTFIQLTQVYQAQRSVKVMPSTYPPGYPTWVDKFYFNDILRKDYGQFKIVRFNVAPLNAKGENYASLMYRVKMTVEQEGGLAHRNFVVKSRLVSEMPAGLEEALNVFPKEIQMYTEVLPQFVAMFKEAGETVRFGPSCFVGTRHPSDLIIMEDLSLTGFRSADRMVGLDFEHVKLTMAKLAKMHAASAVLVEKGNDSIAKFKHGVFTEDMRGFMEAMFDSSWQIQRESMMKWKCWNILQKYEDRWKDIFIDFMIRSVRKDDSRFNVLCHGDLWCNNVMFRYNEDTGKVEDCLLVDYQMCFYNTPMLDLQYFIYTSLQHEVKMNQVDHVLQYYHQQLVSSLKKLGYSKRLPTLLQLQKDFLDVGIFGLLSAFGTFGIAVAPPADDADMENFFKSDEAGDKFKRRLYSNPIYVNAMEDLVPYFEMKGYFDA